MGYVVVREIIGKGVKHAVGDTLTDITAWPQLPNMVRAGIVVSVPDGKEEEFVQALGRGVAPQGLAKSYGPQHAPAGASVIAAQLMRDIMSGKAKAPAAKKAEPKTEAKPAETAEPAEVKAEAEEPKAITKKKKRKKILSVGDE